jgi:hypothetical protein
VPVARALDAGGDRGGALLVPAPALVVDEPERAPGGEQALGGVVLAQEQAELGARRHHAVRLARAAGDQIVDEHAGVRLITAQDQLALPRRPEPEPERRVDPGEQPLHRRLLVPRGPVDLPAEEQTGAPPRLERRQQLARIDEVVLDGVPGARHLRALEAGDGAHERELHVVRQRCRDAVGIDLAGVDALGLEEDLVAVLVRKPDNLVLDARAVPRAGAGDRALEQR